MTGDRFTQVGVDRVIRLAWLEQTASLVLAANEAASIKTALQDDLRSAFRSQRTDVRGSLDKTITILLRVWLTVPSELDSLRVTGLELVKRLPQREHIAIHWGMVMAAYPFWANVAAQTGRLLRLQGAAAAPQVQRRLREQYGERETVSRRVRYVLRSYLDWGVLQAGEQNGQYMATPPLAVDDSRLTAWLVEAALCARKERTSVLRDLLDSPALFPFRIEPQPAATLVSASSRLESVRHGFDDDLVMLRKPALAKRAR